MALNVLLPGLFGLVTTVVSALHAQSIRRKLWIRELERRDPGAVRDASGQGLRIVRGGRVLRLDGERLGDPELRTEHPERLPPGFGLGLPRSFGDEGLSTGDWRLDPHFDVRGEPAWWVRAMLADDAVRTRLAALAGVRPPVRVRAGRVWRTVPGRPVETFPDEVDVVDGLAEALGRAAARTWAERAARPGLVADGDFRMLGRFGAVPVRIVWEAGEDGGAVVLDATVPGAVPPDLRIGARAPGAMRGVPLLDPVLDRHLVVSGAAPARLRSLVCREGVRGPLLALLHEAPGAVVEGPRVRVRDAGPTPDRVLQSLSEAVDVAAALAEATVG